VGRGARFRERLSNRGGSWDSIWELQGTLTCAAVDSMTQRGDGKWSTLHIFTNHRQECGQKAPSEGSQQPGVCPHIERKQEVPGETQKLPQKEGKGKGEGKREPLKKNKREGGEDLISEKKLKRFPKSRANKRIKGGGTPPRTRESGQMARAAKTRATLTLGGKKRSDVKENGKTTEKGKTQHKKGRPKRTDKTN